MPLIVFFWDDKTLFIVLQASKNSPLCQSDERQFFPATYWLGNIRNITNNGSNILFLHSKAEDSSKHYLDSNILEQYHVGRQFHLSIKLAFEEKENEKK